MNKLALFGATGGLGKWITPMLGSDFEVLALGSADAPVQVAAAVKQVFDRESYIPYIIYMAVRNVDAVLHKTTDEAVWAQLEVNANGFLNVLRYGLPSMREHKFGRVLYMSSILSTRPIPGTGVYAATKAFNDNLVKTCALENARYNITCNSIQLGYCATGLTERVPAAVMGKVLERIPVGRLGNAADLYGAITFVLTSSYLTGAHIPLTGGLDLT